MLDDILTEDDWEVLDKVRAFLGKLLEATKALESSDHCIDLVLPAMDYVLKNFEAAKEDHEFHAILGPMLNSGWSKFNTYYQKTDETHAYAAALVLNPKRKWQWMEKRWPSEWILPLKNKVQKVWEAEYKPSDDQIKKAAPPRTTNDFFLDLDADDLATAALIDEYTSYCAAPIIPTNNAIKWWLEETQQKQYPNLSQMALDYLSIPGMSAEAERLFSSAKITLTDRRNRMGAELVEALECLKSWLQIKDKEAAVLEGLVESQIEGLMSLSEALIEA